MKTKQRSRRKTSHVTPIASTLTDGNKLVKLSVEEYTTLRDETNERIAIMNNQGANAFGIVLTAWAAGFGMLGLMLANISNIPANLVKYVFMLQVASFMFSLLMLLPMAIKSGENLRQIISLGTYIRVFYNYLPQHGKVQGPLFFWDTADKHINYFATSKGLTNKKKHLAKWYNHEYIILGLASFVFMIVSIIMLHEHLNASGQVLRKWVLYIQIGVVTVLSLYILIQIYLASCTKVNLLELTEEYMKKYILVAKELGFIEEDEVKEAWNELNPHDGIVIIDKLFIKEKDK